MADDTGIGTLNRPSWLDDPVLTWTPVTRGITLCADGHRAAACAGLDSAGPEMRIAPPAPGYGHLCGLAPLLAAVLPALRRDAPDVLARHTAIAERLERAAGGDGEGFVPISEVAALGTTRRISRESHTTALWIDRAARFLAEALPAAAGTAAAPPAGDTTALDPAVPDTTAPETATLDVAVPETPVLATTAPDLAVLDLAAFDTWDRLSVRILYRAVVLAHIDGTPFLVRGRLRYGLTDFLADLTAHRAVRVCADPPRRPAAGIAAEQGARAGIPRTARPAEALRAIGDALALQNFERADLLIQARLAAAGDPDERADLVRLQAISQAQTGRIDAALDGLRAALAIAVRPELRAHVNYLLGLLLTKRSDDTALGRSYYERGIAIADAQPRPSAAMTVEKAWLYNGLALVATMDARRAGGVTAEGERLLRRAFELEFAAFRMVRGLPGDSAFYLRYNLSHNLAFLLQIAGRHEKAEQTLRSVSAAMLGTGRADFLLLHRYAIGILQLRRRGHEEAVATFTAAVETAIGLDDPFYLERTLVAAGYTALRAADHEAAAHAYRHGARAARRLGDEDAYAEHLAGLLWSLTLAGRPWGRHETEAARQWFPSVARAYESGADRDGLSRALTLAGADVAPPSAKLPSYLPSVDLEGAPGRDLNRFLAGLPARENPAALAGKGSAA